MSKVREVYLWNDGCNMCACLNNRTRRDTFSDQINAKVFMQMFADELRREGFKVHMHPPVKFVQNGPASILMIGDEKYVTQCHDMDAYDPLVGLTVVALRAAGVTHADIVQLLEQLNPGVFNQHAKRHAKVVKRASKGQAGTLRMWRSGKTVNVQPLGIAEDIELTCRQFKLRTMTDPAAKTNISAKIVCIGPVTTAFPYTVTFDTENEARLWLQTLRAKLRANNFKLLLKGGIQKV